MSTLRAEGKVNELAEPKDQITDHIKIKYAKLN
jgi:hypothetical protein